MRKFKFVDPPDEKFPNGVEKIVTENEIKSYYYDHWKRKMIEAGFKGDDLLFEKCLEDWVIINWAEESKDE